MFRMPTSITLPKCASRGIAPCMVETARADEWQVIEPLPPERWREAAQEVRAFCRAGYESVPTQSTSPGEGTRPAEPVNSARIWQDRFRCEQRHRRRPHPESPVELVSPD